MSTPRTKQYSPRRPAHQRMARLTRWLSAPLNSLAVAAVVLLGTTLAMVGILSATSSPTVQRPSTALAVVIPPIVIPPTPIGTCNNNAVCEPSNGEDITSCPFDCDNVAPVPEPWSFSINAGAATVSKQLSATDLNSLPDLNSFQLNPPAANALGTATLSTTGVFQYTPPATISQQNTFGFFYTIADTSTAKNRGAATISVTLNPASTPPTCGARGQPAVNNTCCVAGDLPNPNTNTCDVPSCAIFYPGTTTGTTGTFPNNCQCPNGATNATTGCNTCDAGSYYRVQLSSCIVCGDGATSAAGAIGCTCTSGAVWNPVTNACPATVDTTPPTANPVTIMVNAPGSFATAELSQYVSDASGILVNSYIGSVQPSVGTLTGTLTIGLDGHILYTPPQTIPVDTTFTYTYTVRDNSPNHNESAPQTITINLHNAALVCDPADQVLNIATNQCRCDSSRNFFDMRGGNIHPPGERPNCVECIPPSYMIISNPNDITSNLQCFVVTTSSSASSVTSTPTSTASSVSSIPVSSSSSSSSVSSTPVSSSVSTSSIGTTSSAVSSAGQSSSIVVIPPVSSSSQSSSVGTTSSIVSSSIPSVSSTSSSDPIVCDYQLIGGVCLPYFCPSSEIGAPGATPLTGVGVGAQGSYPGCSVCLTGYSANSFQDLCVAQPVVCTGEGQIADNGTCRCDQVNYWYITNASLGPAFTCTRCTPPSTWVILMDMPGANGQCVPPATSSSSSSSSSSVSSTPVSSSVSTSSIGTTSSAVSSAGQSSSIVVIPPVSSSSQSSSVGTTSNAVSSSASSVRSTSSAQSSSVVVIPPTCSGTGKILKDGLCQCDTAQYYFDGTTGMGAPFAAICVKCIPPSQMVTITNTNIPDSRVVCQAPTTSSITITSSAASVTSVATSSVNSRATSSAQTSAPTSVTASTATSTQTSVPASTATSSAPPIARCSTDPAVDSDGDGIPDVTEAAGPNRGDGDGNGVLDCFEKNVASSCTKPDRCSTIVMTGQCGTLKNTKIIQEKDLPTQDPLYDYPFGLYVFDIACPANASMVQYWYGAPNNATQYTRKYGPTTPGDVSTTKYFDFPSDTRETVIIGGQTVLKVSQTLRDGGFGDATGVDGIIRDPTGVAVLAAASSTPASLLAKTGGNATNILFVLSALGVIALGGYAVANKRLKVIE